MSGQKKEILIIGGGAAGLMAAITAARQKAKVTLLERLPRVGKKLLATGNGRCNYTNTDLDISRYHGSNPKFAQGILSRFGTEHTLAFFSELGIVPRVEQKGKVFPRSGQAGSILDVLRYEAEQLGVETLCDVEVSAIEPVRKGFQVTTVTGNKYSGDKVILSTGGRAASNLGSNGSGFALAQALGHKIIPPFPALVQLKLKADFLKQLAGIKVEGAAHILEEGKTLASDSGEILFTTYGVSGPPILQISRAAGEMLQRGEIPWLRLNITPDLSQERLTTLLTERLRTQAEKSLDFSMVGFLNKQLAPVVIKAAGITDIKKPAGQITSRERTHLLTILQDWRFEVTGTLPWSQAQVTAGGIDTAGIDPQTLESLIVPGLYFAGEVIDIDGDSGGFNLQWAWATGHVAARAAAS